MNSCAEDIRDILKSVLFEDGSSSTAQSFEFMVGKEPDEPISVVSLFETVGFPTPLTFNKSEQYNYPSVQVRVRAYDYVTGYSLANEIKEALHGRAHETWNGTFYSLIYCVNGPFLLDFDKNQRPRFVLNFNIQRR